METQRQPTKADKVFAIVEWVAITMILAALTYICVLTFIITEQLIHEREREEQIVPERPRNGCLAGQIRTINITDYETND